MAPLAALVDPVYTNLGVALALGLLLGMQRERSYAAAATRGPAGVRTFPMVALLGGLSVLVPGPAGPWVPVAGLLAIAGLNVVGYLRSSRDAVAVGLTTEVLLLLVYVLGALAASGMRELASIAGAVALVLTGLKPTLHKLAGKLTDEDERATLKLVAVALLVVPLLPDRDLGPFHAINPHDIGWMALLVASISFVGYVAVKTAGAGRGILITGLLGGLASSTATTAALARRSRETPELSRSLAAGATAACAVQYPRLLVVVAVASPDFFVRLWPYLTAMGVATAHAAGLGLLAARRGAHTEVPLQNPFELAPAIWFALIFGVVGVVAAAARAWFGDKGLYATAAMAGATDMDAITLTAARLFGGETAPEVLARTVTIAAMVNAIAKSAIAIGAGSREFGRRAAIGLIASVVVGALALLVL